MSKITVLMPTYNRPEGFRLALESVLRQTYKDFVVIVSDNASTEPGASSAIENLCRQDSRIRLIRQPENIGPGKNFIFLANAAKSDYLIFLADDDTWTPRHLECLVSKMSEQTILVFPDADLIGSLDKTIKKKSLYKSYARCVTDRDYLVQWCKNGSGQPFYGLYNLSQMKCRNIQFDFTDSEDMTYFNEGLFLHKLFMGGGVRFAPEVSVQYSTTTDKGSRKKLADSFLTYSGRVIRLYLQDQRMPAPVRDEAMRLLINQYSRYLTSLCIDGSTRLPLLRRLGVAARVLASGR